MKKIRAVLLGCGVVGQDVIRNSAKRGVEYIGIFDINPHIVGTKWEGIPVMDVSELESFVDNNDFDIAVNTATAPMERTLKEVRLLLSRGKDVLTSLADIYVMQVHEPEMFAELDRLGKENGATFFASGIQDVFWTALPLALTGCSVEIEEIRGTNVALIDFFGPGVADECYVGWDLERFEKASECGELPTNDFLIALYEIVEKLGLHPVSEKSEIKPLLAGEDLYFETIDRHVKKGQLLGNFVESRIATEEGIDLVTEFVSKMSEEGDTDLNKWEIKGTPNINIITEHMQGEITTGSNIVNRIPDVINAPAGVVSASSMEPPFFKHGSLADFVKEKIS